MNDIHRLTTRKFLDVELQWLGQMFQQLNETTCYTPWRDGYLINPTSLNLIIKYLAIECYEGLNDHGIDIYEKLPGIKNNGFETRFKKTIDSFKNLGYDENRSDITVHRHDKDLINGSHTLACCVYFNTPIVTFRYVDEYPPRYFKPRVCEKGYPKTIDMKTKNIIDQATTRIINKFY